MSRIEVHEGGAQVVLDGVAEVVGADGHRAVCYSGDDLLTATYRALSAAHDPRAMKVAALVQG